MARVLFGSLHMTKFTGLFLAQVGMRNKKKKIDCRRRVRVLGWRSADWKWEVVSLTSMCKSYFHAFKFPRSIVTSVLRNILHTT